MNWFRRAAGPPGKKIHWLVAKRVSTYNKLTVSTRYHGSLYHLSCCTLTKMLSISSPSLNTCYACLAHLNRSHMQVMCWSDTYYIYICAWSRSRAQQGGGSFWIAKSPTRKPILSYVRSVEVFWNLHFLVSFIILKDGIGIMFQCHGKFQLYYAVIIIRKSLETLTFLYSNYYQEIHTRKHIIQYQTKSHVSWLTAM